MPSSTGGGGGSVGSGTNSTANTTAGGNSRASSAGRASSGTISPRPPPSPPPSRPHSGGRPKSGGRTSSRPSSARGERPAAVTAAAAAPRATAVPSRTERPASGHGQRPSSGLGQRPSSALRRPGSAGRPRSAGDALRPCSAGEALGGSSGHASAARRPSTGGAIRPSPTPPAGSRPSSAPRRPGSRPGSGTSRPGSAKSGVPVRTPHTLDYAVGIEDLVASTTDTSAEGREGIPTGAGTDGGWAGRFIPSTLTPTGSPRQLHLGVPRPRAGGPRPRSGDPSKRQPSTQISGVGSSSNIGRSGESYISRGLAADTSGGGAAAVTTTASAVAEHAVGAKHVAGNADATTTNKSAYFASRIPAGSGRPATVAGRGVSNAGGGRGGKGGKGNVPVSPGNSNRGHRRGHRRSSSWGAPVAMSKLMHPQLVAPGHTPMPGFTRRSQPSSANGERPSRAAREEATGGGNGNGNGNGSSGSGSGSGTLIDPRDQRPFSSGRPSSAGRHQRSTNAAYLPGNDNSSSSNTSNSNRHVSSSNSSNQDIPTSHLVRQRLAGGSVELLRRQSSPASLVDTASRSRQYTARARSLPGSPRSTRAVSPKLFYRDREGLRDRDRDREGLRRAHMGSNGGNNTNGGRPSPPDGRRSAEFLDGQHQALSSAAAAAAVGHSSASAGGRGAWTSPTGDHIRGRLVMEQLLDSSGSDSDDEAQVPALFPLPRDMSGLTGCVPGNVDTDQAEVEYPSMLLQESAYMDAVTKVRGNHVLAYAINGKVDGAKLVAAAETIASWQPALRTWFPGHRDERGALVARVTAIASVHVQLDVVEDGPAPPDREGDMKDYMTILQAMTFRPESCAVRLCLIGGRPQGDGNGDGSGGGGGGGNSLPHTLAVVFARYACDLVAAHVFMRQLCEIYSDQVLQPSEMLGGDGTRCSVAQIAQWEAKHLRGNPLALGAASTFWSACCRDPIGEQTLRKLQLNNAAAGTTGAEPPPQQWAFHALDLDEDTTTNFKEFLVLPDGAEDITNADLGLLLSLTTFAVLMRHVSEQDDFVMGSTVSVRDLEASATHGLLGPLTNEVPLHVITSHASSFIDIFVALGRMVLSARQRAMCSVRSFESLHGLDSFPVRFEFIKSADVAQIASDGVYSAAFLGAPCQPDTASAGGSAGAAAVASLGSDCRLTFRGPPPQGLYAAETNLVLRVWESPDASSDQIYGGFWYRSDLHSTKYIASLIEKFGIIAEEASDEPHITMAKVEAGLK